MPAYKSKFSLMRSTRFFLYPLLALALASGFLLGGAFGQAALPGDVENLKAVAADGSVTLTWNPATAATGQISKYLVFQGTQSVTAQGGRYEKNYDAGNKTTYTVTGLNNDTKYYFAVVAFDTNGEHSENYSNEISATPAGSATASPKVSNASALNNIEVAVTFSTPVVLPAAAPEKSFSIKENITDAKLEIVGAQVSAADPKVVVITTGKQKSGNEYILTANSDITDQAKNPVKSGTSDTASFRGSALEKVLPTLDPTPSSTPAGDTVAPKIVKASPVTNNKIRIEFSEAVVIKSEQPESHFTLTEKNDETRSVEIKKVSLSEDKKSVEIETGLQVAKKEYVLTVLEVKDLAGNAVSELFNANKAAYFSVELEIKDILPPEDVTEFLAQISGDAVKLSWTASVNSAKDLVDQIVYQSTDNGKSFAKIKNLGPAVTGYTIRSLQAGMSYTFKLTVKDASGNESEGVVTTVTLPETGAGLGLGLMGTVISLVAYHRRLGRKKI